MGLLNAILTNEFLTLIPFGILIYYMTTLRQSKQLEIHSHLSKRAFETISEAIDMDSKDNLDKALELYKQGKEDLLKALSLSFSVNELQTVMSKNGKMRKTLEQIQDRIDILERNLKRSRSSIERLSPAVSAKAPAEQLNNSIRRSIPQNPTKSIQKQAKRVYSKEQKVLAHQILDEILISNPNIGWADVIGITAAKKALYEIVILPYLRPELFTGLRAPTRGVLLFGPPGTGKTMLAKAVASEASAKFFAISASSLTSKNYGEGEKLVRALFEMARELQPSIIFIDEIDSILTERSDSEHEASRRLKTEFLLQFDGIGSNSEDRVLLLAATNRPNELDEAALRRMTKRIYIPLPEHATRIELLKHIFKNSKHSLNSSDFVRLSLAAEGYSSSDITALAKEAALGPIRELGDHVLSTPSEKIRPISITDCLNAMKIIRPSVSKSYIKEIEDWNREKGVSGI